MTSTSDEDLCFMPATEIARNVRQGTLSAVEVMRAVARRSERVNPHVNALVATDFDRALETAAEPGAQDGALAGVPVSIKDLTDAVGMPTTYGSTAFADNMPAQDAEVVRRIRAAGAVVFAKTNTPEFGAGTNTDNELFGPTRNPWDLSRTSGGSSGGAAVAVAAGLGPISEGTDHGCSVRLPAAFNGVVGLRTTPGRVPQWPSDWIYDPFAVTGPLARTVDDCELFFEVMAGGDDRVPISLVEGYGGRIPDPLALVKGARFGWSPDLGLAAVDEDVLKVCEAAVARIEELGAVVEQSCPDFSDIRAIIDPLRAVRQVAKGRRALAAGEAVGNDLVTSWLARAREYTSIEVGQAEARRSALWGRMDRFFDSYDFLVTVTTQSAAYPVEQKYPPVVGGRTMVDIIESCLACYAISMTGTPAISIPVGFTPDGLPVGLQVIARPFREAELFAVARVMESVAPWADRRPAGIAAVTGHE